MPLVSPECARTEIVNFSRGATYEKWRLDGAPPDQPSAQGDETAGPADLNAEPSEVGGIPQRPRRSRFEDAFDGTETEARNPSELLTAGGRQLDRAPVRMAARPCELRIVVERKMAVLAVHELLRREAVLAHQVVRLIKTPLAERRRPGGVLERRVSNRPERRELRMMNQTFLLEPLGERQQLAIRLPAEPHDELRRRPRPHAARLQADPAATLH